MAKSDQLVLTWINFHYSTSKEAWLLLDRFLSSLCSIHIKALQSKLRASKKKLETPMLEYLMEIRATTDAFVRLGLRLTTRRSSTMLSMVLMSPYRSFLTHLSFNPSTSFDELVSHLLIEEDLQKEWATALYLQLPLLHNKANQINLRTTLLWCQIVTTINHLSMNADTKICPFEDAKGDKILQKFQSGIIQ